MKVKKKLFLHSSKDSNYETANEMGLSEEAAKNFSRSLYEVEFVCLVDKETGDIEVLSVNIGDGEGLFTR